MDKEKAMVDKVNQINQLRFTDIKVGNAITITFLRCLPGFNAEVASRLCELREATIYRVFGEADYAIVREFSDQPVPFSLDGVSGLSHLRTITAFSWEGLNSLKVADLRKYPLVGFCFLKAHPDFLCDHGIEGEHMILKEIKQYVRTKTRVRAAVCGTAGWFEAILLICGETVGDILTFAYELRRLGLVWRKEGTEHKTPCFQTTETIPAVLIKQGSVTTTAQLGKEVKLELRARCYSWADSRVQEHLSKLLGTPEFIAGTDDFIIRDIRPKTLPKYIRALWDLWSRGKHLLHSTSTSFVLTHGPQEQSEEVLEIQPPTPISIDLGNRRLQKLSEDNPTLYQTLRDTYALLNDIMFDFRKNAAVVDLVPFAQELLKSYTTSKYRSRIYIRKLNKMLGQCLDMLRWGAQQRYLGTHAFSLDIAMPLKAGGAGGIHRILTALSLIPEVMMQGLGRRWTGFVTCGWTDDYKRFIQGVLNVPFQSIFQPNTWFVVFHEIGHEYASQIDLENDPNIRRALMKEGMCTEQSLQEAFEVYAEIFSCLFGFGGDFNQCVSYTWNYLKSLDIIPANLSQYFLRFLMANIFILEDSGHQYVKNKDEIKLIAVKLKRYLNKDLELISDSDINDNEIESICLKALRLRAVLNVIRDLMPPNRISRSSQRVDYTPLQDGRILLNIDDPVHFLSSVPSFCSPSTFRQSVAIILSIWNAKMLSKKSN